MKKKLKAFKKWMLEKKWYIIFLLLIIVVGSIYKAGKEKANEAALLGIEVQDYDAYMEELKNIPSDIEGLSKYDKYKKGLDYKDGSDSDYDGLTDKEEIEIYGTDPLKASTANDLYTDKYKVENGMDLFKYYEYDQEIIFNYNNCVEVQLEADEPTDFYTVVEDYTNRYSLVDFGINTIYKGYWIYNYNGNLKIDLSNILVANNIDTKDISVWVYKGDFLVYGLSELERCNYTTDGNIITLSYEFDRNEAYYVYITEKKSGISSFLSVNKNASNALQVNGSSEEVKVALMYSSPILEQFFGISGHLYYTEIEDETEKDGFVSKMIELSNVFGSRITKDQQEKITTTSVSEIHSKVEFLRKYLPMCELEASKNAETSLLNLVFNYTLYMDEGALLSDSDNDSENGDDFEHKIYNNYHTEFDPYEDELSFQNFESKYAPGGNCAGISHLTAYLFNKGTIPTAGTYGDISWNLNVDAENETLSNPGLSDYKSRDFVDRNSGRNNNYIEEGLTAGEEEFVKMIGAFWKESNDRVKLNDYVMTDGRTNDWSLAEKMTNYLDQGKILCVGMLFNNGTGHEVNLYDYYYIENGELIFRLYDSNIPQNYREGYVLNCDGACYLQCKKVIRPDGSESFTYIYWPIEGNAGYLATSDSFLMEVNSIVVTDEEWNVFND